MDPNESEEAHPQIASEDAIIVSTVHKSKGLEYPIVYCPFFCLSSDPNRRRPALRYAKCYASEAEHGKPKNCFDIGSESFAENEKKQTHEEELEEMRLLYVAFTRAKHRLIMAYHAGKNDKNPSPLSRLFSSLGMDADIASSFDGFQNALEDQHTSIEVLPVECPPLRRGQPLRKPPHVLPLRETLIQPTAPSHPISRAFDISSFSSLSHQATEEEEDTLNETSLYKEDLEIDLPPVAEEHESFSLSKGKSM